MAHAAGVPSPAVSEVRSRILETAYELFSQRGVRDVGINEVVERAHVTKATLYHHFASKDDLVVAFLDLREERWMHGWVQAEARRRADTPEKELLAIFDLYDEWFHRDDYEACSFVNVLLELGADHPAGRASIEHLANLRSIVRGLAADANLEDAEGFTRSWYILMKGSIVAAAEGYTDAARRAKEMATRLIEDHRSPAEGRPRGATRDGSGSRQSVRRVTHRVSKRAQTG
jgi:AcrR family transcriptional regulator